jgi:hypothetical protein
VKVVLIEPGSYASGFWQQCAGLLPDAQCSVYSDQYAAVDNVARRDLPGPRPVALAVLKALTAPRPLPRYLVGSGLRTSAVLDAALPTAATDWAKQLATGLRTGPPLLTRAVDRVRDALARRTG